FPFASPSLFFPSRGLHTRSDRDWSSDVCSSDLKSMVRSHTFDLEHPRLADDLFLLLEDRLEIEGVGAHHRLRVDVLALHERQAEIGRASCRERGWRSLAGVLGRA